MQSIRARLGSGLFVLLIVLFLLQLGIVSFVIRHLMGEVVMTRLMQDADSLLAVVEINDQNQASLSAQRLANVYQQPFSGHYFHIEVEGKDLHSRSLWDEDLHLRNVAPGEHEVQYLEGPLDQWLMVYVSGYRKHGKHVVIAVAQDVSDLSSDIREMQLVYGGVSLVALLLLVYLQNAALRWSLAPVEKARAQLRAIENGEVGRLDEQAPVEILPLVQEINRLLDLLSQRLTRSRNALGNLAHALKTPLTVMTQLSRDDGSDKAQALHDMQTQIATMRGLVERELKRARLASGGGGARFTPADDVNSLVTTLKKIYADKHLNYQVRLDVEHSLPLDREDMLELLGNLLDNASKWARSQVRFQLYAQDSMICMHIEDDGPGVDEQAIAHLQQRGVRVDESIAGHGLGLAIVSDSVASYGGQLQLGRSVDLGGFSVKVCLPV
ncbi:MAG: sensor histidine kinase [Gammaproteobacteria bacterium]|nr:sensor histidine kinase [Gammaproteobacteria bacterium]